MPLNSPCLFSAITHLHSGIHQRVLCSYESVCLFWGELFSGTCFSPWAVCAAPWLICPWVSEVDLLEQCCWCCCSVTKLCPTLRDPMDCSSPGLPVSHYLPEFAQVLVHWIGDVIHPVRTVAPDKGAMRCKDPGRSSVEGRGIHGMNPFSQKRVTWDYHPLEKLEDASPRDAQMLWDLERCLPEGWHTWSCMEQRQEICSFVDTVGEAATPIMPRPWQEEKGKASVSNFL